ncbi:ABC transporter permease [Sporanaerobium hydrogeniformans]|uniref:ABC transporter permease n=1 Tax=Sporanaerobium hydrogeniformans TaxID=3072179 RepID=A0AC61DKT6_9FIRM|nr:carbohydrate ABC transporter permease [Sporanaerobium hydrogeniformans]PHV72257.1 ABC transporter permease [Sporanaerobium hydrogeniformans]
MIKRMMNLLPKFIMFLFSLIYILPIWMVFINSIKDSANANMMGIGLPEKGVIHLGNYFQVIREGGIARAFMNGIIEATGSVVIIILAASCCAFILARKKGKLYDIIFYSFIMGLIVPVAFIPTYLVLNALNLLNTYAGIILIFTTYGLPMSVFLYTGFIKSIPRELDEAAIIDGCGSLRLFFSIIFPLLKPVTMTVFILSFIGAWNDVMIPMFFANGNKWALPLTVYNFYGGYLKSWNLIFADIIITITPLLIIYLFGQKYIVSGMTAGAVKG